MKKLDAKKEKNGFFAHLLPITFSSLKNLFHIIEVGHSMISESNDIQKV